MMKLSKKLLTIILAFCLILSLCMSVFAAPDEGQPNAESAGEEQAEGESAEGESEGESGGESGGMMAGNTFLSISDGELTINEDGDWTVEGDIPTDSNITGIKFTAGSCTESFLSVSTAEHVSAEEDGFTAILGDDQELFEAPDFTAIFTNEGLNPNAEGFDLDYHWISQIDWDEESDTFGQLSAVTEQGSAILAPLMDGAYSVWIEGDSKDDEEGMRGPTQVSVSGGGALLVQNAYIYSEGLEGLAISNNGSADVGSTMVVKDSLFVTRGYVPAFAGQSENLPNDPLLVTGADRTNLSGGESKTYYYDSVVTLDGWASLSTDGAKGAGVDLVAVNTFASSLLGGYGTYADGNCRDYLYGTALEGAEIGAIIAGTGEVSIFDGDEGLEGGAGYGVGLNNDIDPYAFADQDYSGLGGSIVAGGRYAVMIHLAGLASADPQGYFYAKDSYLATDRALLSDEDAQYSINASWYGRELSPNIQKYIEYTEGDIIFLRGTNAEVILDNVEMSSYNNVLIHSALNNDTSTPETPAGTNAVGNRITIMNTEATGNIVDDDYERVMKITLDNSTLTGAITSGTCESWTNYWLDAGYAQDYTIGLASNTFGSEAPLDAFVHSVTVNEDGTYEVTEYGDDQGTELTLTNGSVWNVAGSSNLTSLTVEEGCEISGIVSVDGEVIDASAGSWTGNITIEPIA